MWLTLLYTEIPNTEIPNSAPCQGWLSWRDLDVPCSEQILMKQCCKLVLKGVAIALGTIMLDMALFRSVYHPLVYLYSGASWWFCRHSTAPSCGKKSAFSRQQHTQGLNGVVVTSQREASAIGVEILEQGGNAVDAAVAVGYALAVAHPCCGNLGGGGFMILRLADGTSTFINFREKAPLAATPDMYRDEQGKLITDLSTSGYLAVGVPGTVAGFEYALTQYGTMPRQQVMEPAIKLAQEGFILQQGDADILQRQTERFKTEPNVAQIFLKDKTQPYQVGDRLIQDDLAHTLTLIAHQGLGAFYQGEIAEEIVQASERNGGILTREDFAQYEARERSPLRCIYRGYDIQTTPPPGGGTTLCQMLKILEGYPLAQHGRHSTESLHFVLAAMLFAFGDRNTYLGDPEFVENPLERLLSEDYVAQVRAQIPVGKAIPPEAIDSAWIHQEGKNTTHYSIVDRFGNAVAVTYTINSRFGAGVIAGNTGFFLNNEMDDFTAKPGEPNSFGLVQGEANSIAPGKQPLSSMAPTIVVKDDRLVLVTGSPGGSTIPTTVLQVILNLVDFEMDAVSAVNTARVHYQGLPNVVITEPHALDSNTVTDLWGMGYKVIPFRSWGAAQSIQFDGEISWGVLDLRRPAGQAVAFYSNASSAPATAPGLASGQ